MTLGFRPAAGLLPGAVRHDLRSLLSITPEGKLAGLKRGGCAAESSAAAPAQPINRDGDVLIRFALLRISANLRSAGLAVTADGKRAEPGASQPHRLHPAFSIVNDKPVNGKILHVHAIVGPNEGQEGE